MKLEIKTKNAPRPIQEVRRSSKFMKQHVKNVNTSQQRMRWYNYSWCR